MARRTLDDSTECFKFFPTSEEFDADVIANYAKIPDSWHSKTKFGANYRPSRGFEGTDNRAELDNIKTFIDPTTLDEMIANAKELFAIINLGGAFEKDRMKPTDRPIGVFDFSLASKGLYKPMEYYCEKLDKIIDPTYVSTLVKPDGTLGFVYYEKKDGITTSYQLKQQQEGTFCMKQKALYKEELISEGYLPEDAEIKASKKFPNCRLVFATRTKKVYLTRIGKTKMKDEGDAKYVDLYTRIGGLSYVTPEMMLWRMLPLLLVSYF